MEIDQTTFWFRCWLFPATSQSSQQTATTRHDFTLKATKKQELSSGYAVPDMLNEENSVAIYAKSNRIYNARVKVFPCVL